MPMSDFTLNVRITGADQLKQLARRMQELHRANAQHAQQIRAQAAQLRQQLQPMAAVAQAYARQAAAVKRTAKTHVQFGNTLDRLRGKLHGLSTSLYVAGGNFVTLGRWAAQATLALEGLNAVLPRLGRLRGAGPALAGLGGFTAAGGLGLASLGLANFEEKLIRLRQVSGQSGLSIAELRDAVDFLQQQMRVFSGDQLADALTVVVKAGYTLDQALSGLTQTALKFSYVAEVPVTEAVETLSKASKQTGLDWGTLADAITKAADISELEIADVARTLLRGGAAIRAGVGLSVAEVLGLTTQLTRMGLEAETAGVAIRRLASEATAFRVGELSARQMRMLAIGGQRAQKALRDFQAGVIDVLDFIHELSQAGLDAGVLINLFGERAGQTAVAVAQAYEDVRKAAEEVAGSAGIIENRFAELIRGLKGQILTFGSLVDRIWRQIREPFLGLGSQLVALAQNLAKVGAQLGRAVLPPVVALGKVTEWGLSLVNRFLGFLGETSHALYAVVAALIAARFQVEKLFLSTLRLATGWRAAAAATGLFTAAVNTLRTTLRLFLLRFLPLFVLFEGSGFLAEKLKLFGTAPKMPEVEAAQQKQLKELKQQTDLLSEVAFNTAPLRQRFLLQTNLFNISGAAEAFKRLFGETVQEYFTRRFGVKPLPGGEIQTFQSGVVGLAKSAAPMVVGEAGTEFVAVIRDPRLISALAGGGEA